ncbi:MAG: hypothetical protein E6Q36_01285 [Chryseobacterium sp.]|nr:MAG: hypothetical protein E6Q36_01285 [Chryseobacterium sp.]
MYPEVSLPMNPETVVLLMETSKSEQEWNDNCDKVKSHFGGYPSWWFQTIVLSGVLSRIAAKWKN